MRRFLHRLAAAVALCAAPAVFAQVLPVVRGEPALASKAAPAPRLRLEAVAARSPAKVRLAPLPPGAIEALREENLRPGMARKRLLIGINRDAGEAVTATGTASWEAVADGHVARLELTSPEAGSLRLELDLQGLPADAELVFQGSDLPGRLEGPVRVGDIADRSRPWWGPLTEGETQLVEVFVPSGHAVATLAPRITGASHIVTTPSSRFTKRGSEIGLAGSCNVDLACSPLNAQTAFAEAAASVAQMVFTDSGSTGLCTGTLLNDTDPNTQTPWFYSANHCFDRASAPFKTAAQMQAVADTLTTLWFFEASACRGTTPVSHWVQQSGGARFLYNNPATDVLFLRLNTAPPAGAFFAGWDANPLAAGTALVTIHHPQGDLKKVSQGSMQRYATPGVAGGNASFIEALWSSGTTEPGSSGAGVWSSSPGAYSFRGGLWGGTALCTNPTGTDFYSRLDQAYPQLAQYLAPSQATPFADFTDLWWNPSESGWGLSLIQHPTRQLFGVWYTYALDGKRTWFVLPSGTWTSSSTYTGTLYRTTGPAANGAFDPARVSTIAVGTATLTFRDASNGTFAYTVDGVSGSKSITRQPF